MLNLSDLAEAASGWCIDWSGDKLDQSMVTKLENGTRRLNLEKMIDAEQFFQVSHQAMRHPWSKRKSPKIGLRVNCQGRKVPFTV